MQLSFSRLVMAGAVCTALSACSVIQGEKIDYKSARPISSLEVPPDLTRLSSDSRYQVPKSGTATASDYSNKASAVTADSGAKTAISNLEGVRIEGDGGLRWLVTNRSPERIWSDLQSFWEDSGFAISTNQPAIGVMETEWAENRAKLPMDFIRSTLGRLVESLYSTGELDKFRTRVERNAKGETEIYISHRGMIEVYSSNDNKSTTWQPRPSDPALESEFLRRLMLKLGAPEDVAKSAVARSEQRVSYATAVEGGLRINDTSDRAWRRVGLALDRTGFTVVSRDSATATYQVRYVRADNPNVEQPGFFAKLFSSKRAAANQPVDMSITVTADGAKGAILRIQSQDKVANQEALDLLTQDLQ
ncbi:MAG: hypothetical protein RL357_991 [Pseudomonadota bacterium]